ncbi:MAG: sigma-70 family RNA polymerase sigma factor [Pirellulales bacterium]
MSPVRNHPELVGETAALGQSSSAEQADARPADAALLGRLQNRDEEAANEVFQRYVRRLTALARSRLSASMAARFDADDVVMSAYRSFFIRAREGQFALEAGGDLWRLLVEITLHKLYRKSAHHQAQKRSTTRETAQRDGEPVAAAPEPTPDVALAMAEELAMAMQEMPGEARSALELRLKGHELREIAEELNCSERTVRRWLDDARAVLRRRFPEVDRTLAATQTQRGRRATTVRRRTKSPRRQRMARPLPQAPIEHLEFSDYLLRRQLGAGATGKVFLATDKRHARDVAVKFLRKLFLRDADVRARFVAEAGLIAALDHPGLV